jgi:hypothetical protein
MESDSMTAMLSFKSKGDDINYGGKILIFDKTIYRMAISYTTDETLSEIVREVKKMDDMEMKILLKNLRLRKLKGKKIIPAAKYDSVKVKLPTMAEIDQWKHEARKDPRYIK